MDIRTTQQWLHGGHAHAVQFYENEEFLYALVADYLADGLVSGEPVVVIATAAHREAFAARLREKGFDEARVTFLDAAETLAGFMNGAVPDEQRFVDVVGAVIASRCGEQNRRVRAYGEMVDLLWRDGKPDAALRLEELWNDLANRYNFILLCAYWIKNFYKITDAEGLEEICATHTQVIPTESYVGAADEESRNREVILLQQRAAALEAEVRHRKELEHALRQALEGQRRAALENARLLELAQQSNRAKDEFLATVSHELRTPLTAILGWAKLLEMGGLDEETARTALQTIVRSARTQSSLIEDLLDLSRIVTGKLTLQNEPVEVVTVVSNVVKTLELAAAAKRIEIEVSGLGTRAVVNGDATRLQQIVWNLLSNAIKFSDPGGKVWINLHRGDDSVTVEVCDRGRGIAAEFLPYVFEPFRQADGASTRSEGGLGLGLAIVKYLAEHHGGEVHASSGGEGQGATFTVTLPLAAHQSTGASKPRQESVDLRGTSVLLVEDDHDTREVVKAILLTCGADVDTAESVQGAREALGRRHPHVLVTDIAMPEHDGYELLNYVRGHGDSTVRGIPVVALTAFAIPRAEEHFRAAGFHAYVQKPVDPLYFASIIAALR